LLRPFAGLPASNNMPFTSALVQSIQKANNGDFANMRESFEENEIKLQALNPLMRSLRNQLSYALHELHDGAVEVSGPLLEDVFVKVRNERGRKGGLSEGRKWVEYLSAKSQALQSIFPPFFLPSLPPSSRWTPSSRLSEKTSCYAKAGSVIF